MTPAPTAPTEAAIRPVSRWRPWLVGLVFWAAIIPLARSPRHSGNVWSRYMTVESIVERGTLAVDRSPLRAISGSPDLIKVGAHFYSDKPPVLPALAAAVYLPLYASGWTFHGSLPQFVRVNWVLVSAVSGLGAALAVVALRRLMQLAPIRPIAADALAIGFGFGSLLLTYGVTFNNHGVAAGLLTLALAEVAFERIPTGRAITEGQASRSRFRAGLLASFGAVIDLPAGGAMMVALGVWTAFRRRGIPWSYLAGAAGPLLIHGVLQTLVSGSPLPVEMTPELFAYPGSYWTTEAGKWREPGPRWRIGLELLFGPQGWVTVTPALAIGLVGMARIAARKGDPLGPMARAVGGTIVVVLAYYIWGVRRTDFAGLSFGTRHLLPITPAVFLFAVIGLGRFGSRLAWIGLVLLLLVGMVYAWAGMRDPWSRVERRDDSGLAVVKPFTLYPWSSYRR